MYTPYTLPGPLTLSRATVDRASHLRSDSEQLAEIWSDPRTRVLVVADGRVVVAGASLLFVEPDEAPGGERYLLGLDGDIAYTAVHATTMPRGLVDGDAEAQDTGRRALTLREVGAMLDDRDAGLAVHALALANWHAAHTHCPRCGERTEVVEAGHARRCAADGSEHYPRVDPAVIMLVTDDEDRCLLGRQRRWPPRRFSTLAGFVEPGETPERAVAREVYEEVGIEVQECWYAGAQPWPFPSSLMLAYYARASTRPPRPDGWEIEEAGWFTRAELESALREGRIALPPAVSIARQLIEGWYGGTLDGP
ncbi:NAD(+) diphosphatase [Actinobacteria bacterium YIM 96077]|uniref:NAD(+) diphosphatase n=1 Tax=Phytoactinopolyspora halophila TaxID=1981511 RepID=A0A329R5V0_9ACTN|nr:NAD(+) diphosphatase [Phytoactinopolyspora halophila]AYY11954.1 NAD(+) diphosphatase [Actinobacteria bacterium YIM 96077]RAW18812.1 NAD(+) diphosphatase [Phytoactinopolyspora halophila]